MNINWVFADSTVLDPMADITTMKEIGPMWGSWRTWRGCQSDNVICHNLQKSQDLIKRDFQNICNFFIPNEQFVLLGRPENVKLYEGKFVEESDQSDEIVAMHLVAGISDIVLLVGFNWTEQIKTGDKLVDHQRHVYRTLVKLAIENNPNVQWVLVDHPDPVMKILENLENLSVDTMDNVLSLLDS